VRIASFRRIVQKGAIDELGKIVGGRNRPGNFYERLRDRLSRDSALISATSKA